MLELLVLGSEEEEEVDTSSIVVGDDDDEATIGEAFRRTVAANRALLTLETRSTGDRAIIDRRREREAPRSIFFPLRKRIELNTANERLEKKKKVKQKIKFFLKFFFTRFFFFCFFLLRN